MRRHGRKPWWTFVLILVALILSATGCARAPELQSFGPSSVAPWPQPAPLAKSEKAQESLPTKHPQNLRQCAQDIGQFTPVRMVIEQVGINDPLTAQPLDNGITLPVPMVNYATTGAWWQDGALPGGPGMVYVGVHTYSARVDATGNKLLRVTPGAIAKLYDANGVVGACYVFMTQSDRLSVSPTAVTPADAYRTDGQPGLTVMTCDGYDPKAKVFTIREYYLWTQIWLL